MRAYNKWLLVQRIDETVKLRSGIELSATDMEDIRYQRGRISSTPGNLVSEHLTEGMEVYFDKVRAFDVTFDGKMCTVINENDIVAVL